MPRTITLLIFLITNTALLSNALALDPPSNIRIEDGSLLWEPVPDVLEYHIYYFDEQVPSETVLGNYFTLTGGTQWSLDASNAPFGFYTVVSIQTFGGPAPVEFSAVTDGEIVPYFPDASNDDMTDNNVSPTLVPSGQQQSFYPGDDGATQIGVQPGNSATNERYTSNGDGTFTDNLTNLVWIADAECIPLLNWVAALDYANALTADGSSSCASLQDGSTVGDWRLANIVELLSLYDYGSAGAIGNLPLANLTGPVIGTDFWSSTSFSSAPTPNDIGLAWEVKYLSDPDAGSHIDQKSNTGRAWAVRNRR